MKNSTTLVYDGSFNGFLTSIFTAFEEKINVSDIQPTSECQSGLFTETKTIFTHVEKAKRVWNGIRNKSHNAITNVYFAFLSEVDGIELTLYTYIQKLMFPKNGNHQDYSDGIVARIGQLARSVANEKHRMETSVQFQLTKDNVYFASIAPNFDILPLVSKHFRNRYPEQEWFVYDTKRKYGIFCNLDQVELVSLDLKQVHFNKIHKSDAFLSEEYDYQTLWNDYLKNTNIKSQIKRKLVAQPIAKRNWKYLSEKKETA